MSDDGTRINNKNQDIRRIHGILLRLNILYQSTFTLILVRFSGHYKVM